MRLRDAKICFDDDTITDGPYCPTCGREVKWHLSTWLDRRPEDLAKKIKDNITKANAAYVGRLERA